MKKKFFLLALFLMMLHINAQQSLYTLTTFTATYSQLEDLTIPTDSNGNKWLEDGFPTVTAPFPFKIAGQTILEFSFVGSSFFCFTQSGGIYGLTTSGLVLQKRLPETGVSTSVIGYKTEGEEGSRILKIEVKNAGLKSETVVNSTNNIFMNYQIWIYEGTDVIEYRYGTSNITPEDLVTYNTPMVMNMYVIGILADPDYNCFVYENLANPTFIELSGDVDLSLYMITSYPAEGIVYKFVSTTSASTDKFSKTQFSLYPNPTTEILNISLEKMNVSGYSITDMTGKVIRTGSFTSLENTLEIGDLSSGMYCIRIGDTTKKFIKK